MAMAFTDVLLEIDEQISKLQQARDLLTETKPSAKKGPGRPKKAPATPVPTKPVKRSMSEAGRKAIAAAQKKRWAAAKKAAKK